MSPIVNTKSIDSNLHTQGKWESIRIIKIKAIAILMSYLGLVSFKIRLILYLKIYVWICLF